ncbi:hypothetical protein [Corallococcus sp. CA053C]|uniref:hypothetical protein n=1 Tax=Corallococcus sp. CA053C TaxID=2316732 RepID=UPI00131584DC|nr:hypothetical protein [Corallococcus sp. CA053C]
MASTSAKLLAGPVRFSLTAYRPRLREHLGLFAFAEANQRADGRRGVRWTFGG